MGVLFSSICKKMDINNVSKVISNIVCGIVGGGGGASIVGSLLGDIGGGSITNISNLVGAVLGSGALSTISSLVLNKMKQFF